MDLVKPNSEMLREECEKFDFQNPPINPVELYRTLGNELIEKGGIGLAAPQLGLPYHFFVIRSDPVMGFFNAKIVDASEEVIEMEEGCLSFPGIILKVVRPRVIKVRYTDPAGNVETKKFQDMTARVVQHELDHCNGIIFTNRVSRLNVDIAMRKAKKEGFNYTIGDLL